MQVFQNFLQVILYKFIYKTNEYKDTAAEKVRKDKYTFR